ncbi:MAG: alpha/beta hydrolase family protein [Myxococcota bacterium]
MRARLHRFADDLATGALRVPRLYPDGFGSQLEIERIGEHIRRYERSRRPPTLNFTLGGWRRFAAGSVRRGWFRSPTLHLRLPEASRTARFEWIQPDEHHAGAVVLHLAASGEVGFFARRLLARRLLRFGIASFILENPFYGSRRPSGQTHAALRSVRDQFAMNFATVEEGRAILQTLKDMGYSYLGVTGYSQGGVMAAFCAALTDFPVAVAARGMADSVADLFTRDNFSQIVLWDRLAIDCGSEKRARHVFRRALEVVRVSQFPPPLCPEAAILLASRYDRFIDPGEARRLHRHWRGSELRWLTAGHVTGLFLNVNQHVITIRDAFTKLQNHVGGKGSHTTRVPALPLIESIR